MNQKSAKNGYTRDRALSVVVKKLKLIICISLVVSVLAAIGSLAFGIMYTPYGNTVSFYLSKRDASNKLLPFLTSEVFAERLLLDEYGLPAEFANDPQYKDAYEEAKQAIIVLNEAREELEMLAETNSTLDLMLTTPKDPVTGEVIPYMEEIETRYERLKKKYDSIYDILSTYLSIQADGMATEEHMIQIRDLEAQLEDAEKERDAFRDSAYYPALREKQDMVNKYSHCAILVRDTRRVANELRDALLNKWRENDEVQDQVAIISNALYFSYEIPGKEDTLVENEEEGEGALSYDEMPTDAYYFLKVYVSVKGDEEFANFIIDRLKVVIPDYVEQSIEQFDHWESVECIVTSPFSKAYALDISGIITSTALVTIIAFVAIAAIMCCAFIGKDWLRATKSKLAEPNKSDNKD